ncbi:MAG: flagellar basal body-associated FliL family protein [bacterium]
MAEEEKKDKGAEPSSIGAIQVKGKSSTKLIIIVIVVLALSGGGYLLLTKQLSKKGATEDSEKTDQKQPTSTQEGVLGPTYPMNTFIVNVSGPSGSRFLKVNMEFELENGELNKELDSRKSQIRDTLIDLLSSKTVSEVSSSQGKKGLRREILYKLNSFLITGKIKNVFFTEFVMQ